MIVDTSLDNGEGQKVSFVKHIYLILMTAPVIIAGLFWNNLYQSTSLLELLTFKP